MPMNEEFKKVLKKVDNNQSELARQIGSTQGVISMAILRGRVSGDLALKIAERYPDINAMKLSQKATPNRQTEQS